MSDKKQPSTAVNTAKKQRGRPFRKGESGNPAGKPSGSRNRITLAAEKLLDNDAKAITQKCVELAKAGDSTALRLCIERLIPPVRERRIALKLPKVKSAADVTAALGAVLQAVAGGAIAPSEGSAVAGLLEATRRSMETNDLECRVAALEGKRIDEK